MNAIYCTCISKPWVEIAVRLNEIHNIKARYFISFPKNIFDSNFEIEVKNKLSDCYYQTIFDAIKGLNFLNAKKRNCYDEEMSSLVSKYEVIALEMMNRFDPSGSNFSTSNRLLFFRTLLENWLDIIDELEIDLVISPSIPHRVYDYALYVAAKIKKIKFITFKTTSFSDYAFLINSIEDNPIYLNSNNTYFNNVIFENLLSYINSVKEDPTSQEFYQPKQRKRILSGLFFAFVKKIIFWSNIYKKHFAFYVKKQKMPYNSYFYRYDILFILINRYIKLFLLKRFYESISTKEVNITQKYIVVALHQQPEETSCPLGGVFTSQILIIKMLNKILDNNVLILVKEHSSQFNFYSESPESSRNRDTYKQILKISNRIQFVSTEVKIFELIPRSIFVTTITGTVGLEAVLMNKPVLCFGNPWYVGIPGVFRISNFHELTLAIKKMETYQITKNDIDHFFLKLSGNVFPALICAPHEHITKTPLDISIKNIINNILFNLSITS